MCLVKVQISGICRASRGGSTFGVFFSSIL